VSWGARIPVCWPTPDGRCGCGRGHGDKEVGKAALVSYIDTPPTPERIAAWWRDWPRANVGLLLDQRLVIDCDSDDALGEATALGLPPAPVSTSGRGRHYHYRRPADAPATNTTHRGRSKKIDVLARGYVIVSPSVHRTGARYGWLVDETVNPLGPAPAWAVAMLRAADVAAPAPAPVTPSIAWAGDLEGLGLPAWARRLVVTGSDPRYPSRSEAVFAALMQLIRVGCDDATIADILLDARYGISDKPREKGRGRRWLAQEVGRARAKCPVAIV
jgi:hypothetical protein